MRGLLSGSFFMGALVALVLPGSRRTAVAGSLLAVALVAALAIFAYRLTISEAVPQVVTEVAIDAIIDDNGDQLENGAQGAPGTDECYDGVDNDGDTLTDGLDPACRTGLFLDNNDTAVGYADYCVDLSVGQSAVVDLWVKGVDPADLIKAYRFDIDYNNAVIDIGYDDDGDTAADEDPPDSVDNDGDTAIDEDPLDYIDVDGAGGNPNDVSIISRIASAGGAGFLGQSDTLTNASSVTFAAADLTANPPPPANHESGDGVLARFVVSGVSPGISLLFFPSFYGGADGFVDTDVIAGSGPMNGGPIPIDRLTPGGVWVGMPCSSPPTDTKVTAVTTTAPANGTAGVAFDVTANATLHNNGGWEGVTVDTSVQLNLPGDCATDSPNPATVVGTALPISVGTPLPEQTWSVTCTDPSLHDFTTTATVTINTPHTMDPYPDNNTLTSATSQTAVCLGPNPPWFVPPGDGDCDGYSSADEGVIGTDPADNCPDDPADDAWPPDFDMNTVVNLGDLINVLPPHFGSSPAIPDTNGDGIIDWSPRRDLVPDGVISLADVFMVLPPYFASSCTP